MQSPTIAPLQEGVGTRGLETRPYPPSWVDHWQQRMERLPGSSWLYYLALTVFLVLAHALIKWGDGSYPMGTFHPFHIVIGSTGIGYLAFVHYLDRAALRAMERFRPIYHGSESELADLTYCLTTLPARPTLWVTLAGSMYGLLIGLGIAGGMVFESVALVFTSPAAIWFEGALGIFVNMALFVFVYHTIHQLRTVHRIYGTITTINLFDLAPLHAFSAQTAQTAAGGILVAYAWMATEPGIAVNGVSFAVVIVLVVLALVTFLWPLLGIHRRLIAEKTRAQAEAGQRIRTCILHLHDRIDDNFGTQLEAPIKALEGLRHEQQLLEAVPTWPWRPGTIQGLSTAILT